MRAAWAEAAAARRAALETTLLRSKVELIALRTDESIGEPVARFFNRRRRTPARAPGSGSPGSGFSGSGSSGSVPTGRGAR